jgi:hypothetical protein
MLKESTIGEGRAKEVRLWVRWGGCRRKIDTQADRQPEGEADTSAEGKSGHLSQTNQGSGN